jgi:predicted nucleotidyltransferase
MALEPSITELEVFCQRWGIAELAVFGSAVRDDFGPDSDVDLLVEFLPATRPTLMDLVRMKAELEQMIGRPVDLLSRNGVTASRNYIRRDAILRSAKVLYAA